MKDFSSPTTKERIFALTSRVIEILTRGKYSLRTAKKPSTYPEILSSCAFAIDVGVAYGTPWLESLYKSKPIFYVEGNPKFYDCISKNLIYGRESLRELFRCCAGNTSTQAHLIDDNYASRLAPAYTSKNSSLREVPVRRLDELGILETLSSCGLPSTNGLLKVDTEGFELCVIQGAFVLLDHISVVVIELRLTNDSPYNPHDLIDLLAEHGFRWHSVMDYGDFPGFISFIDLILVKD